MLFQNFILMLASCGVTLAVVAPTFATNCGVTITPATAGGQAITKEMFIRNRLADAVQIATQAAGIRANSPGIDAFTNYFFLPGQSNFPNADRHLPTFQGMMAAIRDQETPLRFECPATQSTAPCVAGRRADDGSLAVTEARRIPSTRNAPRVIISICPLFFTSSRTALRLASRGQDTSTTGWGNPALTFANLETGAHTLLHELTHVDAIASAAGLTDLRDPEIGSTASTLDQGASSSARGSRQLKTQIENAALSGGNVATNPGFRRIIDPWRNAESYAAAATEFWVRTIGRRATRINT